ncbi:hypothetical protein ACHAQF_008437 [Verticillium nonalfalfae]
MADLTPVFNELLAKHSAPSTRKKFSLEDIDGFLKEAYRINSHITTLHNELKDVRQSYLSTAQPRKTHIRASTTTLTTTTPQQQQQRYLTDRDREDVDANAKQMLRELNASIRALEEAETLRRQTEAALIRKKFVRGLGALGAWAAGDGALGASSSSKTAEHAAAEARARDEGQHRDGVVWFLRQRLQLCGRTQQAMMETRLTREMEKSRSVLAKAGPVAGLTGFYESRPSHGTKAPTTAGVAREEERGYRPAEDLTEEQIQMFEKGNQDMLQHYNSTLDKVRTAEKSLIEISELQTLLVGNLATQSANIEQLVADSENMGDNVGGGNKQLKEATKRPSAARYTFFASAGLCAFLIVWDLIL